MTDGGWTTTRAAQRLTRTIEQELQESPGDRGNGGERIKSPCSVTLVCSGGGEMGDQVTFCVNSF